MKVKRYQKRMAENWYWVGKKFKKVK
jgi:hypothetical protein